MSLTVAAARRDAKIRDLNGRLSDVTREYSRVPIGMNGEQNAYLAERRQTLQVEMRRIEDEMAEFSYLEGDALVQAFDPAPVIPEELKGLDWTDTLNRGPRMGRQVVVSIDGRPLPSQA